MVDPASGSQQQQQPPTLSITVVPLNVLDDPLESVQELDGDEDLTGGGRLLHPLSESAILEASQSFYEDIVDDVILGIVFEVHRGAKLGLTALLEDGVTGDTQCDFDGDETTRSSTGGGGEAMDFDAASEMLSSAAVNSKKPAECVCPNCQRNMAASRFAPHLEKCMGMGRNSSRLASRRIATSASRQADLVSDDDCDDDDWTASGASERQDHRIMSGEGGGGGGNKNKRRHHLHKKDKNSPRRKKWKNGSNGDNNHSNSNSSSGHPSIASSASAVPGAEDGLHTGSTGGGNTMETMGLTERRTLLTTMCGVISEHTGRMCTRSLRCPQHTDSQRKNVRQVILEHHTETESHLLPTIGGDKDKEMIDVDTWEEGDSLASLLTAQSHDVPTPGAEASPAESTSTSASSTSSSARRRTEQQPSVTNNKTNSKKNNGKKFKGEA
ncbi:ataxin-7-like protein 3 [Daphnia pulex]|uniref:ataxin-7-like protein 3 n=1 Tax=Daphnia pulex TaxID=6669 RepID=UPI001EDE6EEC|nr:ataxin-7-like protein 3 [Daphnia pulex]XP_046452144.1 ataxin-7-like protein 3 [Daphnia pulex]